uniref:BCL2 associated agonist of cell death b n=1 Tax=Scophthalmus maximus TaxID=52904 RepID=A0A8D3B5U4_SCOMX
MHPTKENPTVPFFVLPFLGFCIFAAQFEIFEHNQMMSNTRNSSIPSVLYLFIPHPPFLMLFVNLILTRYLSLSRRSNRSNPAELGVQRFHSLTRREELLTRWDEEAGTPTDGAPFRGRSKSAPPALWAAMKYGQKLRRMSDEFDSLLDKGEMRKVKSAGTARQMHHSQSWWSYLFSHQEMEGENNHHENHTQRNE